MSDLQISRMRRQPVRGFTLIEIAVCVALLATLFAVLGKTIAIVEMDMRLMDERAQSIRAVENLLERFLAAPWDSINEERIRALAVPAGIVERRPRTTLSGSVVEVIEPVLAKRITLTLSTGGSRERPITLTTWIYHTPTE